MLPPLPCRIISRATACAVMKAPVMLTCRRQTVSHVLELAAMRSVPVPAHAPAHTHLEHGVGILGRVLQRRRLLLDARRRNEPVELPLAVADALDDPVETLHVPDVDLPVMQRRPQFLGRPPLHPVEVRTRLAQAVQRIYRRSGLEQRFCLHEPEAAGGAGDEDDFVVEVELGKTLGRAEVGAGLGVVAEGRSFFPRRTGRTAAGDGRVALRRVVEVVCAAARQEEEGPAGEERGAAEGAGDGRAQEGGHDVGIAGLDSGME